MGGLLAAPRRSGSLACTIYVSCPHDQVGVLDTLAGLATDPKQGGVVLVNRFYDQQYGRGSFLLGVEDLDGGAAVASEMVGAALSQLTLLDHGDVKHPRIGVVDHISVSPLDTDDQGALADAARFCRDVASRLAAGAPPLPIMLYGGASAEGKRLVDCRKETKYFSSHKHAQREGGGLEVKEVASDMGPKAVDPAIGVCCVGAVTLVCNFNVLVDTTDRAVAMAICNDVRTSKGGPPGVEAMALQHEGGKYEVACNLLDIYSGDGTDPKAALRAIEAAAAARSVAVLDSYTIGFTVPDSLEKMGSLKGAA